MKMMEALHGARPFGPITFLKMCKITTAMTENENGNQVYDVVVSLGMGNDLSKSIVDAWN